MDLWTRSTEIICDCGNLYPALNIYYIIGCGKNLTCVNQYSTLKCYKPRKPDELHHFLLLELFNIYFIHHKYRMRFQSPKMLLAKIYTFPKSVKVVQILGGLLNITFIYTVISIILASPYYL